MSSPLCLNDIMPGECGRIASLELSGSLRRRLLDLGMIPGTRVECVGISPFKDPKAYLIRGAVIALRSRESRLIQLEGKERCTWD